jgi:hypothetical protein
MALTQLESYMVGATGPIIPKISSITYAVGKSAAGNLGGETLTLTGAGFNSGCTVYVDNVSCTTTYVSNTSVTFTSPRKEYGTYHLYVYNTDGSVAMKPNGIAIITIAPSTVEYLVVAGGGGGGRDCGGGGGAGGLLASTFSVFAGGTSYTITVGAGGTGSTGVGISSYKGNDSSIVGTYTTVQAIGGGSAAFGNNSSGGSGGGGTNAANQGTGTVGPPRQGYDGGAGTSDLANYYIGGGGGGASAVGANGVTNAGGAGGAGAPSSITGTSVTYAGGGGGGGFISAGASGGASGTGGGGAGGGNNSNGSAGTPYTGGGGGGGGGGVTKGSGASGGSGIVVIRYADTYPDAASTTNLAATYPQNTGGYKIYKWITSGTITF